MLLNKKRIIRLLKKLSSKSKFNNIFLIIEQKKLFILLKLKFDNLILYNNFQQNKMINFSLNNQNFKQ